MAEYRWGFAVIRKRRWRIRETPRLHLLGHLGECDDGMEPGKEIRLAKGLKGQMLLDTLIHEMMHAAHPDLREEVVDEACTDIARFIWRHRSRLLDGTETRSS